MSTAHTHYDPFSRVLHWLTAIAVIAAASGRGFIWLFEGGIELWRRHDERPRR